MNLLITGANGQLGQSIQSRSSSFDWLTFFFTDINELDITQLDELEDYVTKRKIHAIVNCAAYTAVDRAESEPELCKQINTLAPKNLGIVAAKHKLPLIHISTDYVFNGKAHLPYSEDDTASPQSTYGWSKWEGEKQLFKQYPLATVIRTSWLYSEYGSNFVKTIIDLAQKKDTLNVVFDQVGTPTYAGDLAECILYMLEEYEPDSMKGLFHFSNEGVASWYDFADAIINILELPCTLTPVRSEAFITASVRPAFSVLDKSKIKKVCNIEIPHWRTSLQECLSHMHTSYTEQRHDTID